MKNIIYLIISCVCIIWMFNFMKLNQLQDRYDRALIEYEYLMKQDSINKSTVDSLEQVMNDLEILEHQYENIDTMIFNYDWGREEIYIYKNISLQ